MKIDCGRQSVVWESVHGMYMKAVCFEVVCEGDFGMLLFVFLLKEPFMKEQTRMVLKALYIF